MVFLGNDSVKGVFYMMKSKLYKLIKSITRYNKAYLTASDFLIVANDADFGFELEKKRFSQILDSISILLSLEGYRLSHVGIAPFTFSQRETFHQYFTFNFSYYLSKIKKILPFLKSEEQIWLEIFSTVRPKAVIAIGGSRDMWRVAHSLGIIKIEIMHGVGYTIEDMKFYYHQSMSESETNIADYFLALDELSFNSLSTFFSLGNKKVFQVYHPLYSIQDFISKRIESSFMDFIEYLKYLKYNEKKIVLFSSQWGYGGEYAELNGIVDNGLFPDELIRALKKNDAYLLFRLHPVLKSSYRKSSVISLLNKTIKEFDCMEFDFSSKMPLSILLSYCDLHITLMSSTAYEAAWRGIPTLGLCPTLKEGMPKEASFVDLEEKGYFTRGSIDENFISVWINTSSKKRPLSHDSENITQVLKKIIDK